MTRNEESYALESIFKEKSNFIIIGLTGRTGSGCSTSAEILSSSHLDLPDVSESHYQGNERRKYKIVQKYLTKHRKPFNWIQIRNIITYKILFLNFNEFVHLLGRILETETSDIISALSSIKDEYCIAHTSVLPTCEIDIDNEESKELLYNLHERILPSLTEKLKIALTNIKAGGYIKVYQTIGDNIRSSGQPNNTKYDSHELFTLPKEINKVIKSYRYVKQKENKPCYLLLDAIRNPYEAIFLRDRYASFYLMAINTSNENRLKHLQNSRKFSSTQIQELDNKEYPEKLSGYNKFISQNIQKCIELADIHINNPRIDEYSTSELRSQLAWYTALMLHPGLVMPTSLESSMQIAYSVKQNSGCISRQVGAVVTDSTFSVKAVGWNSTPQGQVPCILRSAEDLLNGVDESAYSSFEKNDTSFRKILNKKFNSVRRESLLEGRNLSFCFKDIKNEADNKSNQVHTRALHAEENAFLQISKYGGQSIQNGILFTTASPCELCAKKAYQLGIAKIISIDPYPGISVPHILSSGTIRPQMELFRGAIGRAFYQLYNPVMPYKDELEILLDLDQYKDKKEDKLKIQKNQIIELNENIKQKDEQISQLKQEIQRLKNPEKD
ncbi:deoxycytidylate deaminase [Lelliottia nimipressuralis]|uniref:deoxycytidylate deaminase n=1 Tax=Lelliottia nimipressuralis TaxID=69220 RepID=UPI002897CCDD|nr:deoxycytidylate deaminase [Lelliottia nimipressuralis]